MSRLGLALLALLFGAERAAAAICTASVNAVAFGSINVLAATPSDATGVVTVSCTTVSPAAVSYSIQLGPGAGSIATRKMVFGSYSLAYQLYRDAARSLIWGDGSSGSTTVSDSYALGSVGSLTRTYPVYGRIAPRQLVVPGLFTDLITVQVTY